MTEHCCDLPFDEGCCDHGCFCTEDDELGNLHIRPIASAGTADVRLIITINGDEYSNRRLHGWAELEDNDTGETRGLLFTEPDKEA